MHIVIAADGSVVLEKADEFTAFSVRATDPSVPAVLAALGDRAVPATEDDHVHVAVSAIRTLAGSAVDDAWEAGFSAMCGHARSRGWADDDGRMIKAHIELYEQ